MDVIGINAAGVNTVQKRRTRRINLLLRKQQRRRTNAGVLLVNLMGDQQNGFKKLVPVLKEITERQAWPDLLLLSALPEKEDQNQSLSPMFLL